jgi:hypothetical protein
MFYLNNNDAKAARGQPGYDPLFKIRPVIDTLFTKFQDVDTPEEKLTIDVAIHPFRGCIFFRVYIKGKPHKYGTKMFELCEAKSGYVYNLDVYIKPAAVSVYKYKTGVDRSDQMLSYYSFERKTRKWWEKLLFHLFDLVIVNAHIFHNKTSKKKVSLEVFYEKVAKGLLAYAGTGIEVQGQTSSNAGTEIQVQG